MAVQGRRHRVETSVDGWRNDATWWIDEEQVATGRSSENSIHLIPEENHPLADEVGAIRARFTTLGAPLRATWFEGARAEAKSASYIGTGGLDLVPEEGSPAALREERMRTNPRRYASLHVAKGVADVVVPILIAVVVFWLARRVDLPSLPWPDWDLPSIPWPSIDLPSFPRLHWDPPSWLVWVADHAKYVLPILLGLVVARREITRRRTQDELRARRAAGGSSVRVSEPSQKGDIAASQALDSRREQGKATDGHTEAAGDVDALGGDIADQTEGRPLDEPRRQAEPRPHVRDDRGHSENGPSSWLDLW